jgi:hypothetical protein
MQNAECRIQKTPEREAALAFRPFLDSSFCILHSAFDLPFGKQQGVLRIG